MKFIRLAPSLLRMLVSTLLCLSMVRVVCSTLAETQPTLQSDPLCHDWGVWASELVRVYEGEAGRLYCPLFFHPTLYNYSQVQGSGLTLMWYRHTHTHELEPIDLRMRTRLKHRDALWIQPATLQDSGLYTCMLRNISSCVKIGVQLEVVPRAGECDVTLHRNVTIPLEDDDTLQCPDLQHVPSNTHNVTWYYCNRGSVQTFLRDLPVFHREVKGNDLVIYTMMQHYAVPYTCVVSYSSNGRSHHFTRTISVKAVSSSRSPKEPHILNPTFDHIYTVTMGGDVELSCRVLLPYLPNEEPQVWWSIDNKTVEELAEPRYTSPTARVLDDDFGDVTLERLLRVSDFLPAELHREFRCTAKNSKGLRTRTATLQEEVYIPSVELGCGLGVTLALALLLFVLYRVFRLEVHLLYRSWFGTDERDTDNKEYDVYISYARNGEEEEFVMTTLRRVLEEDLGYSVCIFDRDSLPGGNLVECVLRCMQASRRLMVVLSGECVCEKSVSLLECRLCVYVHHTCHTPLVTVRRRALSAPCSELAELRKISTSVHWHGARSERTSSRFWKLLRLALPLRPLALGPRLIDSTSSHSDLATAAARHPHALNHAHRGAGSAHEPRQAGRDGTRRLRGGRGLGDKRRGCASKGRACAVCVSFQESRRIWDGVSIPQWNTHLQQPVSNGTLTYTTRALTLDPGNDLDSETRHNHCTCEQNNSNSTNSELQTTHC